MIFSDGDDRNSLTRRETAMARVQASDAMLYTIGFGGGATVPQLRASLETYARSTGGKPFFPKHTGELDASSTRSCRSWPINTSCRILPLNAKQDGKWRNIKVRVRKGNYDIRARQGYLAGSPQQAER